MGNNNNNNNGYKYNNQSIQHHHQKHTNTIFLPILCKLSLKDINLTATNQSRKIKSDEPSSPKVSCMGQVKRNNRVTTFPTTAISTPIHHQHKHYSRFRNLFSGKSLLPPPPIQPPIATTVIRSKSCRASKDLRLRNESRRIRSEKEDNVRIDCVKVEVKVEVNIKEMDPPLPVVKKAARDEVNIWKRRGLQGLQIEQIPLPNCRFQTVAPFPPTV